MSLYGAIEAGGTKFVCAVGDAKGNIQERISIPTTTPEETMPEVIAFLRGFQSTQLESDHLVRLMWIKIVLLMEM